MSMWDSITNEASSLWDSASATTSGAVGAAEDWLFPGTAIMNHPADKLPAPAAAPPMSRAQVDDGLADRQWAQAQKTYEERKAASPGKSIEPPRYRDYYR